VRKSAVARIAEHTLHQQVALRSGVHASPEDPRLLDGHLPVARGVERQERHLEAARGLVALGERAQQRVVRREPDRRAVELVARDGAQRAEPVHRPGVRRDVERDEQLRAAPVRILFEAKAFAIERPGPSRQVEHDAFEPFVRSRALEGWKDTRRYEAAGVRAGVELRLRDARDVGARGEVVGQLHRPLHEPRAPAQRERAIEAVRVALSGDVTRGAAHRHAGDVRPARPAVLLREVIPERGGLVGGAAGDPRGAAEARGAPGVAVQDQVRADVRRADVCFGAELLPAVHEQHEPAVPLLGHLDLVHGAAEPPEVGPRARQRLEGGIAECDALGFLAERHGRWDGPWYRSGAQRGADECLSHSGGTGRAPAPPRPHTPTTPTRGRSRPPSCRCSGYRRRVPGGAPRATGWAAAPSIHPAARRARCRSHSEGTGRATSPPCTCTPTTAARGRSRPRSYRRRGYSRRQLRAARPRPGRSRRRPGGDRYQSESWAWTFSAAPLMARAWGARV